MPIVDNTPPACRISRLVPAAKVLFVSQNNDADVVAAVLSNGAKGYVRKENALTDLLPAVEAVLRGDRFVSRGFTPKNCRKRNLNTLPVGSNLLSGCGVACVPQPLKARCLLSVSLAPFQQS